MRHLKTLFQSRKISGDICAPRKISFLLESRGPYVVFGITNFEKEGNLRMKVVTKCENYLCA